MLFKIFLPLIAILIFRLSAEASGDSVQLWKKSTSPRAVAIVVHGLNTSPEKMSALEDLLRNDQVDVLRVTLSGQNGYLRIFRSVSRRQWRADMKAGYEVARAHAEQIHVPLYFLGFSLGGLLGVDLVNAQSAHFDKMVLIAPALQVQNVSRWIKALNIFGDMVVPSASIESYRANKSGTPLAAYNALFYTLDENLKSDFKKANVPTLILMDKQDEMVSAKWTEELIQTKNLNQWNVSYIDNSESKLKKSYRHLMIDEPSMGPRNWNLMKTQILEHLK